MHTQPTEYQYTVRVLQGPVTFTNLNGYQDAAVIQALWPQLAAFGTPKNKHRRFYEEKVVAMRLGQKLKTLSPFGTRLLIRVLKRVYELNVLGNGPYTDLNGILIYINDVLRVRVRKHRHMSAFIELDYNPNGPKLSWIYPSTHT